MHTGRMYGKIFVLALGFFLFFSFAYSNAAETPFYGGTLRVAYRVDPKTLCGLLNWSTQSAGVLTNIYNRLITVGEGFELVPDLAESWKISPDGKQFTFSLAKNVKWHDGVRFTSADVKFHYELLKGHRSTTAGKLKDLVAVETPDDYTVIFRFSKFTLPEKIFAAGHADSFILPKHLFEGKKIEEVATKGTPTGTGPFKVVEYVPGSHVIFEANQDYFRGRPYLDRLIYRFIPQTESALLALETGQVDTINPDHPIPPQELRNLRTRKNLQIFLNPYYVPWRIIFNNRPDAVEKQPWLKDMRVRRAIGHAIDRETIVNKVLFGVTQTTWGPISNLVKWAYNPNLPPPPKYDPALAGRLLDEAGYPRKANGFRFNVKMAVFKTQLADIVAEALKAMLENVGIQVDLEMPELQSFLDKYVWNPAGFRDIPLIFQSGGPPGPDPYEMMTIYHSQGQMNPYKYSNPKADKLLEEAMEITDKGKRASLYKEFQKIVVEDLAAVWLYNAMKIELATTEFRGFERSLRPLEYWGNYAKVWWTKGQARPSGRK